MTSPGRPWSPVIPSGYHRCTSALDNISVCLPMASPVARALKQPITRSRTAIGCQVFWYPTALHDDFFAHRDTADEVPIQLIAEPRLIANLNRPARRRLHRRLNDIAGPVSLRSE